MVWTFHLNISAAGAGAGVVGAGLAGAGVVGAGVVGVGSCGVILVGAPGAAASGAQAARISDITSTRTRQMLKLKVIFLLFNLDLLMILYGDLYIL